ncbi:MAG: hypothetical protein ACI9ND_002784 [Yoonia sp.]|jgi:hypothetical protein
MVDFPPLADDEMILWEGQPDTKLRFGMETLATGIFAGAMMLACLGLATVIDRSDPGNFWLIFAPGVCISAAIVLAYPLIDSMKRRKTSYRLTNKRALILGPSGGTETDGYPIPRMDDLIYRSGTPPTIYFSDHPIPGKTRQTRDVGFERIADAKKVFIMMRDLSKKLHG